MAWMFGRPKPGEKKGGAGADEIEDHHPRDHDDHDHDAAAAARASSIDLNRPDSTGWCWTANALRIRTSLNT